MEPAYLQFNFLVDLGGDASTIAGGFQECSRLDKPEKTSQLSSGGTLVLKRGVVNRLNWSNWIDETRENKSAQRTVVISLKNENHDIQQKWRLKNATLRKYSGGALNAKGTDVAMEEMVLAYERLDVE